MCSRTQLGKWLEIEISPHEYVYESLPFIYYKDTNMLVSMVRDVVETPPKMGGFWNGSDQKISKVMIESSKGMMISHLLWCKVPFNTTKNITIINKIKGKL
jgi:hypothetical protein